MTKQHKIETVLDILALSEEEFHRMLPDLCGWFLIAKKAESLGAKVQSFTWIDDGKMGELHHINLRVKETGHIETIKGSAYSEPGQES